MTGVQTCALPICFPVTIAGHPRQLNSIFVPQVDATNCSVAFDQLLCNVNFQVYAVQNLDRNGLPY